MGGLGTIITIILVVAWVVKGLASATGNDEEGKKRQGRSLEEWDKLQSQRRAEMSDRQEALSEMRADNSAQDPSQMTMAQRIELARQRARQQAGLPDQNDNQAEALQRARAQAQRQAQQQRQKAEQLAQQQRAERERAIQQQRAQQERVKQQRRRAAQQQSEEQAQRQRRNKKQQRRTQPQPARATTGSKREGVVNESMQRVHMGHGHTIPSVTRIASPAMATGTATAIGTLSRSNLRKAFIMKELLDKPVALRDPQAELFW